MTKKLGLKESQSSLRRLVTFALKEEPATSKASSSPTLMPSVFASPSSTENSLSFVPSGQNFPATILLSGRGLSAHDRLNSRSTRRFARWSV
jgi:hypothetical protein